MLFPYQFLSPLKNEFVIPDNSFPFLPRFLFASNKYIHSFLAFLTQFFLLNKRRARKENCTHFICNIYSTPVDFQWDILKLMINFSILIVFEKVENRVSYSNNVIRLEINLLKWKLWVFLFFEQLLYFSLKQSKIDYCHLFSNFSILG